MLVAEKYRCNRQVGWSDDAEVHAGPPDATHGVAVAVKIRHGLPGPPRPDGRRDRFLRAANDQQAAVLAGCKFVAPVFETGQEGNNAFYVSQQYPRSIDSLIQGRVAMEPAALHRLTDRILKTLEDLRDKHARAHGNLKPTNIFLDGKSIAAAAVILSDLTIREEGTNQGTDCYSLGTVLYQLIRGKAVKNFDWPMVHGPDWDKLGPAADGWREFCNVLMSPETSANPDALASARQAFKNMRRLAAAGRRHTTAGAATDAETERARSASPPARKGLLAGLGTALVAGVSAVALALQPADSKAKAFLRTVPVVGMYAARVFPLPTATPAPTPDRSGDYSGDPGPVPVDTPDAPTPEPTVAVTTPPPAPTAPPTPTPPPTPTYIGYASLLGRFHDKVNSPEMVDAPENLTGYLRSLKEDIGFDRSVQGDAKVAAFVKKLPALIPSTGSQAELPANIWVKDNAGREGDVQFVVYHLNVSPQVRMQFNRVNMPNGPAFFLSATTVPLRLGAILAKGAESGGAFQGATFAKGPVSWQLANGQYGPRPSWVTLDYFNAELYKNDNAANPPTYDHPMNGLSGGEAVRLARVAGCTLPTRAQWDAVLASPSGQEWTRDWQAHAKVRGPGWAKFAQDAKTKTAANAGTKMPNDQCFGDRTNLEPATSAGESSLFFEPVDRRRIGGYAHLIGNIGQYVVDNASAPAKFFFAGGSAESPPTVFQSLTDPAPIPNPFVAVADAGFRLAAAARGNGSDKNPTLDTLKKDLDAEIARAQKLP